MSKKKAEALKAAMVRKVEERREEEAVEIDAPIDEDPEFLGEEEPDYSEVEDIIEEDDYPSEAEVEDDDFGYEVQASLAQEAGFEAFLAGADIEDNPFLEDESIVEELADHEVKILTEGWNSGWSEAYRESWTADVILGAKRLVETTSTDEAEALLERLTTAVEVLGEVLDYDAYEGFWGFED